MEIKLHPLTSLVEMLNQCMGISNFLGTPLNKLQGSFIKFPPYKDLWIFCDRDICIFQRQSRTDYRACATTFPDYDNTTTRLLLLLLPVAVGVAVALRVSRENREG